jgi:lipoprotein NlpI
MIVRLRTGLLIATPAMRPIWRLLRRNVASVACAATLLTALAVAGSFAAAARSPHRIDRRAAEKIMADYDRAIETANTFMQLYPAVAFGLSLRGEYFFLRGDYAAAADDLAYSSKILDGPDDMIWLFLARARLGMNGAADLAAGAARLQLQGWPSAVVELFLGKRTLAELQAAAAKAGKTCEGLFYAAQWRILRREDTDAIALYRNMLDLCPEGGTEYGYAITELVRLDR